MAKLSDLVPGFDLELFRGRSTVLEATVSGSAPMPGLVTAVLIAYSGGMVLPVQLQPLVSVSARVIRVSFSGTVGYPEISRLLFRFDAQPVMFATVYTRRATTQTDPTDPIQVDIRPTGTVLPISISLLAPGSSAASSEQIAYPAAVPISGGRLVRLTSAGLVYYSAWVSSDAGSLLGVSLNAADTGAAVNVQTSGVISHIGWGLTAGADYAAGASGTLVTDTTGLAFAQLVGEAIDSNRIIFSPQSPIFQI